MEYEISGYRQGLPVNLQFSGEEHMAIAEAHREAQTIATHTFLTRKDGIDKATVIAHWLNGKRQSLTINKKN